MTVEVTVLIDAPLDRVWAEVEPIEDHVRWMADAESITFTGPTRRGVGTTFECVTRIGPFHTVDRMVVTEWDAPRMMGIRHEGLFTGTGRFTLAAVTPAQTQFTWTEQIRFPWGLGGPVGARAAEPVLRRVWNANLRRLARLVTSHEPGATS
jgi:hypothetical protein